MLMEQNVLRSTWPISDQDYPAGTLTSVEQQHFPSLGSFHSYAPFPPAPQRFKDESPRTFGSLYSHQPHHHQSQSHHHQSSSHHYGHVGSTASQLPIHALPLSLSIPRPAGGSASSTPVTSSRKASEEERKAKHREAQRRFVKRKKAEMVQLKQLAIELALQYQVLEVMSERTALERDNYALESDVTLARDHSARHAAEQESDGLKSDFQHVQLPEFTFEW